MTIKKRMGILVAACITIAAINPSGVGAVTSSPEDTPVDPIGRARMLLPADTGTAAPATSKGARFTAYLERGLRGGSSWYDVYRYDRGTGEKRLVSRGIDGVQQEVHSGRPDISWDGRYVVFMSEASNLVPDDTNGDNDVFLYDSLEDELALISRAETGEIGQSDSEDPRISRDGRFVTFIGGAGLDPEDTNQAHDAFVYEIATGNLEIVSTAYDGSPSEEGALLTSISGDGRFVAFTSRSPDLLEEPLPDTPYELYLRDRQTGRTALVSHAPDGTPGDNSSYLSSISRTGRAIAFTSEATNLGPGGGGTNVFLYDVPTDTIELVTRAMDGNPAGGSDPEVSGNGRFVIFNSGSDYLVPYDVHHLRNVFLYDSSYNKVYVVSHGRHGEPVNGWYGSWDCEIAASSRFVLFVSQGSNVARHDEDTAQDVFYYRITRVGRRGG
jgi:Tol biopolymer transport system component